MTGPQKELFDATERYILCHGEKGGAKCVCPSTVIYAKGGLVRIGRMALTERHGQHPMVAPVMGFDGDKLVEVQTSHVYRSRSTNALRVEFENGLELIGSPEHPIWVSWHDGLSSRFAFKSLHEIAASTEEHYAPLLANHVWRSDAALTIVTTRKGEQITITGELAYALGALVGDGCLNKLGKPWYRTPLFANIDRECMDAVSEGLAQLGCRLQQEIGCNYRVVGANGLMIRLIMLLGMNTLSYFKRIPDIVLEAPRGVICRFLAGLFDTDGTVDKVGRISLTSVSPTLCVDVQAVLQSLGILSVRRHTKTSSGRPTWRILITGRHAHEFAKNIHLRISRKRERIAKRPATFRNPHGFNNNRYTYPSHICLEIASAYTAWFRKNTQTRAFHAKWKSCHSAYKHIPNPEKLRKITDLIGVDALAPFLISEMWVKVASIAPCQSELMDLTVPATHSFFTNGVISHNTWGILDKMVRHLYSNQNALAIIGVRVRSMANKGGAWDKLNTYILPEWRDGMGLNYSAIQKDTQHNEYLWVQNKFGSWSCVVLISSPNPGQLKERMPGYEPSFVFWDELTECNSDEYFKAPSIQLGRRPGVLDVQQFVGACNPKGPSHWVYKRWFEDPFDEVTGRWDPDFKSIYFPVSSNEENLDPTYVAGLRKIYKNNPIEAARMIGGEWKDMPSGEALFRDIFIEAKHVAPLNDEHLPDQKHRIMPINGHPIIIGIDPGSVFNAFIFMQWLPIDGLQKWMVFDEAVVIRKRVNYRDFVPVIMRKVKFWREVVGLEQTESGPIRMPQAWVSDNSAFNQYRPGGLQGSFDVMDLERIYKENQGKYALEAIKIRPCPKAAGSVLARVQMLQTIVSEDRILVSSCCPRVLAMFNQLEGAKPEEGEQPDPEKMLTPRRSDVKHTFDALSYPMLLASVNPTAFLLDQRTTELITPH